MQYESMIFFGTASRVPVAYCVVSKTIVILVFFPNEGTIYCYSKEYICRNVLIYKSVLNFVDDRTAENIAIIKMRNLSCLLKVVIPRDAKKLKISKTHMLFIKARMSCFVHELAMFFDH